MKKIVRLTESDLVRLVKKVIKEQEFDMDMGIDCDRIIDEMEYVYMDTMRYYNSYNERLSPDRQNFKLKPEEMYDELASELSGLLDMADQNDCENFRGVESMYNDLLDMFVEETGMGNDMDNMTESIRRKSKKSSRR
jgi:alpha-L-fucosidase